MPRVRRRTIRKPAAAAKARWYAARGYPMSFIASKLKVARNTVRKWCVQYTDNRTLDRLVARVRRLHPQDRLALIERTKEHEVAS